MLASVHIADVGPRRALALIAKGPSRVAAPGLRRADLGLAAPLGAGLPRPDLGRIALVAMWDDEPALDRFLADAPIARSFADGWHARLAPLRAYGSWPGLDEDLPGTRDPEHRGPVVVLTLGRLRFGRAVPFVRASIKAEAQVVGAPGLVWATGLARPPFVATCSLWQSGEAAAAYAYGVGNAHHDAIVAGRAKPFHHKQAFVRFHPIAVAGSLGGRNPLPESAAAGV